MCIINEFLSVVFYRLYISCFIFIWTSFIR